MVASAGSGSRPVYVGGKVYLAGPYKGAPLSLVVVVPAVSGPYDLGNVAVRVALRVDPLTAQVTAISDSLPQILEGVPLRTRFVQVNLDRPDFTLNPTNCDPFSVSTAISGDEGAVANPSAHFQVANCARLPFAPKLTLKLTGSTKQAGNPALTATVTAKPGEANISRAQVTLPPTELVDNAHIRNICTRVQFNEGKTPGEKCPPGSILGFAKADTPLLEKPLDGPIYLRSTGRAGLPDIVAALRRPDRHRPRRPRRFCPRAPPHHLRNRPRRPRHQGRSQLRRRGEGPHRKLPPAMRPRSALHSRHNRPERNDG